MTGRAVHSTVHSTLRSAALAAAAAGLSYSYLRSRPPGGAATWTRRNHRDEPVTLLEGPAVVAGGIAGTLASGASARDRLAVAIAGAGAAAFGGYDDLAGSGSSKGFRGHLGALAKGEVTTGAVKIAGIGATGLAAALVAEGPATPADRVINACLVAGGANLLNLFDLRPGRAIKVAMGTSALLAAAEGARATSAGPLAAAVALLPEDLGERAMLGDAGANGLGAMLATAAATSLSRRTRLAALAAVAGLTAASEVVSFTRVIERTAPLRWLDMLGRRPAPAAARSGAPGQHQDGTEPEGAGHDSTGHRDASLDGASHSGASLDDSGHDGASLDGGGHESTSPGGGTLTPGLRRPAGTA